MTTTQRYYTKIAAAYVRGKLLAIKGNNELWNKKLVALTTEEQEKLIEIGKSRALKMHRFKISRELPRISKVLGIFRGLHPQSLLDIGTGRGLFLWNLIHQMPEITIQSIDILEHRVNDIEAIIKGGLSNLQVDLQDIRTNNYQDNQFEIVTALEVIEHIPNTEKVIGELHRIAQKYIVISVPTKEDDNPEHIHLFNEAMFHKLFQKHPHKSLKFDYVHNHLIVFVKL